jgi:hypothetical protein
VGADEQFETKLNILGEILSKKREALLAVLAISENQESLYASPAGPERREFLMEMGKEKQRHIDDVLTCDEVFQGVFESIGEIFVEKGPDYADRVKSLQATISEVLELDIKIRAQEEKTKMAATAAWSNLGKLDPITNQPTEAGKTYILEQYRENNRNRPRSGNNTKE